ncbi:MAG: hypothetical protein Kow0056_10570 [Coriobacteriia bacterium]
MRKRASRFLALLLSMATMAMMTTPAFGVVSGVDPVTSTTHPAEDTLYPPPVILEWPGSPHQVLNREVMDDLGIAELKGIDVEGDLAMTACGWDGLYAFDVSDPTTGIAFDSVGAPGFVNNVQIEGDIAYVSCAYGGLMSVDISDPTNLTQLDTLNTSGVTFRVDVAGDVAYIADSGGGVVVADVTDPSSMVQLASVPTSEQVRDVEAAGDYLYVAEHYDGLAILDISDPTSPTLVGRYPQSGSHRYWALDVEGDIVYVVGGIAGWIRAIDVSDPTSPSQLGYLPIPGASWVRDVKVVGDRAYLASGVSGWVVVDVSDPSNMSVLETHAVDDYAETLDFSGGYLWVPDDSDGFDVWEVAEPGEFAAGNAYDTPGSAKASDAQGNTLYVADQTSVVALDVSEPGTPTLLGSFPTTATAVAIDIEGDYAYVGDLDGELTVLDVSDPSAMGLISYTTHGLADIRDIDVRGDKAYVAAGSSGIVVLDVTDPSSPSVAGSDDPPGVSAFSVEVAGDYAYVGAWTSGALVWDVSDQTSLSVVATMTTADMSVMDVSVCGDVAYVSDRDVLSAFDITDPSNPTLLGTYDPLWATIQSSLPMGDLLLVAGGNQGVALLDIEDPTSMTSLVATSTGDFADSFSVLGEWAFVDNGGDGVLPLDWAVFADGYSYALDRGPDTDPDASSDTTTTTATYNDVAPGEWYFHVRSTEGDRQGGLTAHRKVTVRSTGTTYTSLAGSNRYETAVQASQDAFAAGSVDTVVIATGENWPDALGGAALAGAVGGPILLTAKDSIPSSVLNEIDRLGATDAYILGGFGAVSAGVENTLKGRLSGTVHRLGGSNRYETARLIAEEAVSENPGYDGTALIATGSNFPDALAASPLAAAGGWPLFLLEPGGLSSATKNLMDLLGVDHAIILGGPGVVSTAVENDLKSKYPGEVERLSGDNRYKTAVEVATYGVESAGLNWDGVAIATGENFPDALAGGPVQAVNDSVMLLTDGDTLSDATRTCLSNKRDWIGSVRYLGGTGAVSTDVRNSVKAVLR